MGREIGIDFGTTNTVVSYVNKYNMPVTMELGDTDESIIPSAIYYVNKSEVKIGKQALYYENIFPEACIKNFKPYFPEPKHKFKVTAENGESFKLTSVQVAGRFLREVIKGVQNKIAEEYSDSDDNYIDKVVISVPAKFDDTARKVVKEAAKSANLDNVELIAEPTAAAVAYMHVRPELNNKNILVYDFGGGTFDLSLLSNDEGIFKVRHTDGNENLGGNNITDKITEDIIKRINDDFNFNMPVSPKKYTERKCTMSRQDYFINYHKICSACENIKCGLSKNKRDFIGEIIIADSGNPVSYEYEYTADRINSLIEEYIDKTIEITQNAVRWADEHKYRIDRIILAGGSSQIPMIIEKLNNKITSKLTGKIPAISDDDISMLISRGAALVANDNYSKDNIVESTNYEIGVKMARGSLLDEFYTIIPDNQELPYTGSCDFEIPDGSSEYSLEIFQRDSKHMNPKDDITIRNSAVRSKDVLYLQNIPAEKYNRRVYFEFTLNADGSLSVTATIKNGEDTISQNHIIEKESNLL